MSTMLTSEQYRHMPLADRMAWNTTAVVLHAVVDCFGYDSEQGYMARALHRSVFDGLTKKDEMLQRIADRASVRAQAGPSNRQRVWDFLRRKPKSRVG